MWTAIIIPPAQDTRGNAPLETPMRPGDEIYLDGSRWLVLDPDYLGNGLLLEHAANGEERVIPIDEWDDLHVTAEDLFNSHSITDTNSQAVSCPYCGQLSHVDLDSVSPGETMIMDCSVCCQPMHLSPDGDNMRCEPC